MSIEKKKGFLCADDCVIEGFECKCKKCGSTNVGIEDNVRCGTSWTGMFGSVDIVCRDCEYSEEIMSA